MPRSKAQNNNGTLDDVAEFSTKTTLSIPMPGGVTLSTDVYLPITSDSFVISTVLGADTLSIELIPKGTQLIIYPYIIDNNGDSIVNPNPYQLPLVFSIDKISLNTVSFSFNVNPIPVKSSFQIS